MDGWVFAIGDQRTDAFGKGEVERHGNGVCLLCQAYKSFGGSQYPYMGVVGCPIVV